MIFSVPTWTTLRSIRNMQEKSKQCVPARYTRMLRYWNEMTDVGRVANLNSQVTFTPTPFLSSTLPSPRLFPSHQKIVIPALWSSSSPLSTSATPCSNTRKQYFLHIKTWAPTKCGAQTPSMKTWLQPITRPLSVPFQQIFVSRAAPTEAPRQRD
jgi:hypothetical protein